MAIPFPEDNPYLRKGFEPIHFECKYADLVVSGTIPDELFGCLYRIGPNPQFAPKGAYNPLLGDGMIHAFEINNGRVSYRNRWVRTEQWKIERSAGQALFATSGNPRESDAQVAGLQTNGVANTNLVWYAGRLLALEEGHTPIEIDPASLNTLGTWTFHENLPGNMTAHPKIDPDTGEMVFFANFPRRDFSGALEIYTADKAGRHIQQQRITLPYPALIHDFAVTRDFIVFFVCPLTVSIERARSGGSAIAWEPEKQTWISVVSRRTESVEPQWIPMHANMTWHAMNAFNEGNTIYVDVCSQEAAAFPSITGRMAQPDELRQFLTRWRLEWPGRSEIVTECLSDVVCEYPRIDDRYSGRKYRYGYVACCGGPGTGDLFHRGLGRFDHLTRRMEVYYAGDACAVSEPIFIPGSCESEEGDGYLLSVIFDEHRNASHLAIFNAQQIENGPIACALLDHRVPMGFHGIWLGSQE